MNLDVPFLQRLSKKSWQDSFVMELAKCFSSLSYFEEHSDILSFEDCILVVEDILGKISKEYLNLFHQMLVEEDGDKPVIYIYSNGSLDRNESSTYRHELHFYKTGYMDDVYLLLHEFTHILMNRKEHYSINKRNNEIAPIMMEFMVSSYFNNQDYLRKRMNKVIYDSKSILAKNEICHENYDIDDIYLKYHFTDEDQSFFTNDLIYHKNLGIEEEQSYLYGFIYGYYYYNHGTYDSLVEQLNEDRNITLPQISLEDVLQDLLNLLNSKGFYK